MDNIDLIQQSIKLICLVIIGTSLIIAGLNMLQLGRRLKDIADKLENK